MPPVATASTVAGSAHCNLKLPATTPFLNGIFDIDIVNGSAYNPGSRRGADFAIIDALSELINRRDMTQSPLSQIATILTAKPGSLKSLISVPANLS